MKLFRIDEIDVPQDDRGITVKIPTTDAGGARPAGHSFRDGRARLLSLRIVGTSRFTTFFPAESEEEKIGALKRGYSRFERQRVLAPALKVIVPCTYRPSEPVIAGCPTPTLETKVERSMSGRRFEATRQRQRSSPSSN